MKKIALGVVVVLALSLLVVPGALAHGGFAGGFQSFGMGGYHGYGMMGGMMGMMGPGHGMMMGPGFSGYGGYSLTYQIADILKMDANELARELQAGKSYVEIAKSKGINETVLENKLLANYKNGLDQYVKTGALSEEQAKYMQDIMAQRIKYMLNYKVTFINPYGF